ncbi:MAG TPA: SpoIIE family protein phosphatase [Polyangia bacterium]|nr:SpoIIE family protein phosphatase [Polyangia bacterium]
MKMVSGEIEVESPVVVYDYATSGDHVVGDIPIGQALAALGEPASPSELAQRLAVAVAMLWPEVADADVFLPEKGRPLRGVRDARAGAQLLASLHAVWGPIATRGLMPVTPTLLPGDVAAGRGSTMSTPIFSGKSLEGFLVVQRQPTAPPFTATDLEAVAALAEGVGGILPAARERASSVPASWLEQDLSAARDLQRSFLPEALQKNSANVKIVTEYMPAHAVGGDFYDFIDLGGGRVFGVIGDVSGKGVTAALTMARVSADIRRFANDVSGPAEFLERLNNTVTTRMADHRFVTALAVLLDMPKRRWVFANAGHVLPLLRRSTGVVSRVAYSSGPPLGIMPHAQYQEEVVSMASKDILLLATDGVFEVLSAPRRPCSTMGQCQLTELVSSAPHDITEIDRQIVTTAQAATDGRDDLTLLGIQVGA